MEIGCKDKCNYCCNSGCKDKCNYCNNFRVREDFVPTSELIHEKDYDILRLNLSGFKKEEINIELCKNGILKISGQRPVNKLLRFEKDIHVPTNCDQSKINAKFLNGNLYVKHPKLIIPSEKNENKLPFSKDNKKPELDELNKKDNAEHSPPKQPNNHEQTQAVQPDKPMKNAATPSARDLATLSSSTSDEPNKDNKKPELNELNKLDNAEQSPPKKEQPNNHEQTQVATTPKLKVSRNVMKIALVALVVLGIGRWVVNMMSSSKKDEITSSMCVLLQFKL